MASTSRLSELASLISSNTAIVEYYVNEKGVTLSFDVNSTEAFPSDAPESVLQARRIVRESTKELNDLMTGPAEHLRWLATDYHDLSSLRYIYHFKLADAVPLSGTVSYEEVAKKAGVDQFQAKRVIRHAQTNRLFCEPQPGVIGHSAGSALLVRNRGVRDWVGYTTEESFLCASKLVEATEKWGVSDKKDQSAYNLAFDTPLPMFEHMSQFPERAERFANTMADMTSTDAYNIRHLVNGFDWETLEAGSTIVDVGGSTGHASIAIAEKVPSLNFIVQDLQEVVTQGQQILACYPNEQIRDHIQFEVHDFFTPQRPRNAAVYLMRFVLHDHPDISSIKILRNIVPALRMGDRIVVMDGITPEANTLPPSEERTIRIMDMEMMTTFNSSERELAQWEALFANADSRLKLRNVVHPPGSVQAVMEVVFEEA